MLGDGFQYYVRHFWNFPDVHQIWTLGPFIYYRNIKKEYARNNHTHFEQILFANVVIQMLSCLEACAQTISKIGDLEIWNFEVLTNLKL